MAKPQTSLPVTYTTIDSGNFNPRSAEFKKINPLFESAYALFVKLAPELFKDDTINKDTGQTIYADIETNDVWKNFLQNGVVSHSGKHQAVLSVAHRDGEAVGFLFSIYNRGSNTASFTYLGVNHEDRDGHIAFGLCLNGSQAIDTLARAAGHKSVRATFVEVEHSNTRMARVLGRALGFEPAMHHWQTPLLIPAEGGGYQPQKMDLLVLWSGPNATKIGLSAAETVRTGFSPVEMKETVDAHAVAFSDLYGREHINGQKLYPKTPSLGYRSPEDCLKVLAEMSADTNGYYSNRFADAWNRAATEVREPAGQQKWASRARQGIVSVVRSIASRARRLVR